MKRFSQRPELTSSDLPYSNKNISTIVIVYGALGSKALRELHDTGVALADDGKANYILRNYKVFSFFCRYSNLFFCRGPLVHEFRCPATVWN